MLYFIHLELFKKTYTAQALNKLFGHVTVVQKCFFTKENKSMKEKWSLNFDTIMEN